MTNRFPVPFLPIWWIFEAHFIPYQTHFLTIRNPSRGAVPGLGDTQKHLFNSMICTALYLRQHFISRQQLEIKMLQPLLGRTPRGPVIWPVLDPAVCGCQIKEMQAGADSQQLCVAWHWHNLLLPHPGTLFLKYGKWLTVRINLHFLNHNRSRLSLKATTRLLRRTDVSLWIRSPEAHTAIMCVCCHCCHFENTHWPRWPSPPCVCPDYEVQDVLFTVH